MGKRRKMAILDRKAGMSSMGRDSRDVTIKDVAKRAGVAISTVSRVLNGLDKVSEKTERRVKAAVEELGYVKNTLAVSMVTGQTKTVMMVVPDFTNDFNGAVIQGAEAYLKQQGYTMLVFSTKDFREEESGQLFRRFSKLADGMLVVPSNPDNIEYEKWEKPLVLIDCYRPKQDYCAIEVDNMGGAALLTALHMCADRLVHVGQLGRRFITLALFFVLVLIFRRTEHLQQRLRCNPAGNQNGRHRQHQQNQQRPDRGQRPLQHDIQAARQQTAGLARHAGCQQVEKRFH